VNQCQGRNFSEAETLVTTDGIGSKYTKARYLAYTDDTFTKIQVPPASHDDRTACQYQWSTASPSKRCAALPRACCSVPASLKFPWQCAACSQMLSINVDLL